jgi:hypothetical protein
MSTARGPVTVLSQEEYNITIKSHRQEWLIFSALAFLIVALPYYHHQSKVNELRELTRKYLK